MSNLRVGTLSSSRKDLTESLLVCTQPAVLASHILTQMNDEAEVAVDILEKVDNDEHLDQVQICLDPFDTLSTLCAAIGVFRPLRQLYVQITPGGPLDLERLHSLGHLPAYEEPEDKSERFLDSIVYLFFFSVATYEHPQAKTLRVPIARHGVRRTLRGNLASND